MERKYIPVLMLFFILPIFLGADPPNDKVWAISVSPRYVWLAYGNGEVRPAYTLSGALRRYDRAHQSWRTFTIEEIFKTSFEAKIRAVCADGNTVWVGVETFSGETIPYACAKSTDNGETWSCYSTSNGLSHNDAKCIEIDPVTKTVFIGHRLNISPTISRTTDGGATWTTHTPNNNDGICAICAYNGTVWAGSYFYDYPGGKILFKSTDNGDTWEYFDSSDTPSIHENSDIDDICMVTPNEVHCAFYTEFSTNPNTGGYVYTTDGGDTWHTHKVEKYDEYCQSITVAKGKVWIAQRFSAPEEIYRSDNNGISWEGFGYADGSLPYIDPFVIRYDEYADIVWAGFNNDAFNNFTTGWCWTDDDGETWHTDNPPVLVISCTEDSLWNLYE